MNECGSCGTKIHGDKDNFCFICEKNICYKCTGLTKRVESSLPRCCMLFDFCCNCLGKPREEDENGRLIKVEFRYPNEG